MPQEQYTHHRATMPSAEGPQVYKVGIYGWRKRCLYFFVLLLMILILVNLAMTIWILKVMNFTIDGMGNLRITEKGLKLEGDSEFLQPLYAKEIQSRPGNALYFKSARNVTVNILNEQTKVLTQLITGPKAVEAYGKKFEVKTVSGKLLFSADNNEVVVGAERLRVLGAEGTVFPKSIETPNVRADPFKELSAVILKLGSRTPQDKVDISSWRIVLPKNFKVGVPDPVSGDGGPKRSRNKCRSWQHGSHLQNRAETGVQRWRD
ncbi:delta-sarcoglycan isoform X2 [Dama dama]|uniref:delta-sarcoglycan isoform X2 n=1 Tax=Dama dama TaxID=30532 RepID=UPI002A36A826|nr:delta-sarcoglycan isoform X2 [Dama dama]